MQFRRDNETLDGGVNGAKDCDSIKTFIYWDWKDSAEIAAKLIGDSWNGKHDGSQDLCPGKLRLTPASALLASSALPCLVPAGGH